MRLHVGTAAAAVVLAVVAAACGDGLGTGSNEGDDPLDADASWRVSTDPVDTGGLVWLGGTTVHLGDGTTIELPEPAEDYVVAGDGVFWLVDDGAESQAVVFTDADGTSTDTGLDLMVESLQASPDGRYLAGVDRSLSDERDQFGTPLATALVLDLSTGEEIVNSTDGMSTTDAEDLEVLYDETEIGDVALTDDEAIIDTTEAPIAWDLATGESEPLNEDENVPGPPDAEEALTSPDGQWRITQTRDLRDTLDSTDGRSVTPDPGTEQWALSFWIDDRSVAGVAVDGPGGRPQSDPLDRTSLTTCSVPTGDCDLVEESTGQKVFYPQGSRPITSVDLQDGRTS